MKIAFLVDQNVLATGNSNGIRMQALVWKNSLEQKGHFVELVNPWIHYDWKIFDALHFFGSGHWLNLLPVLARQNPKIVFSPIIDSIKTPFMYKLASYVKVPCFRLYSQNSILRDVSGYVRIFLSRSEYESKYIAAISSKSPNIRIVPLSPRVEPETDINLKKEDFCLHVSLFTQPRKNVMRLMKASDKYGFRLVIAGNCGKESDLAPFKEYASSRKNIEILGFQTEEQLKSLYDKAKIFALPSIEEGVGLVALEAAIRNCGIVITSKGGPKEYYGDDAYVVNPYSIDEIGKGVMNALENPKQPKLRDRILSLYNLSHCTDLLVDVYRKL